MLRAEERRAATDRRLKMAGLHDQSTITLFVVRGPVGLRKYFDQAAHAAHISQADLLREAVLDVLEKIARELRAERSGEVDGSVLGCGARRPGEPEECACSRHKPA